jgi:hypothetical protein
MRFAMAANLLVPLLAALTSLGCMALLFHAYTVRGSRVLYWCAVFFLCMMANNVMLLVDFAVPDVDLRLYRFGSSAAGLAFLLYGLVYEPQ